MKISMIVAMAENLVIGRENKLPWYLPNDLKYFKQVTMGKPILMGRKTYESIGRPLPGRTNIVMTRSQDWSADGVKVVHSVDEALALATAIAEIDGQEELMVIGGDQIYRAALPKSDRLYLTEVHETVDGDAYFPSIDRSQWTELSRERFAAEGPNPYDYSFVVLEKRES
jgi:dihydrofolate reductase